MTNGSELAIVGGGIFTLLAAGTSGTVAYLTALKSAKDDLNASQVTLNGELQKIREEVQVQQDALERANIAELNQR